MRSRKSIGLVGLCASLLASAPASAAQVPFSFDPSLAAKPTVTQQHLSDLVAKLPSTFALPSTNVTVQAGAKITASFMPEMAASFQRAGVVKTTPMAWPGGMPALCVKHDAFTVPDSLLVPDASPQCRTADQTVRQKLAASSTCRDVEQPERYVLSYAPAVVDDTTTGSIESLIGLAGEALSHYPTPDGLLPPDWVPTARSVIWKIRRPAISQQIATARASYKDALAVLTTQSACFDASAQAALVVAVNDLDAELGAADLHVAQVDTDGKAKVDQENVCLAARARKRETLPFPSLTADERKFVAFWLGGVYWRLRGGGLIPLGSTQKARTYFLEHPFRKIGEMAGGPVGDAVGEKIFLNIFDGWGEWMDMGTTPGGGDLYDDLVKMTDRGRQQVADPPTAAIGVPIPIGGFDAPTAYLTDKSYDVTALLTGGLSMGPCYAYALNILKDFRYADTPMAPYNGQLIEGFTAVGEFCSGASIALGMTETLLDGAATGQPPVSACGGRQCGDDGCGGSCGTCASGTACSKDGLCVVSCTPSCTGKTCGDDGCGGSCGACDGTCNAGQCVGTDGSKTGASPTGSDGSSDGAASDGSCGCRTTPASFGGTAALGVIGLLVAAVRRRKR